MSPVTPQSPAAQLFGYEVADDINKHKSLLKQCTEALVANGVSVVLPASFATPNVGANKSGTPYEAEIEWVKNIQNAILNSTHAVGYILGTGDVRRVKLSAIVAGAAGKVITFKVEAGSVSGCKVTITDGVTPEVYDNIVATAADIVTAVQGVSLLVTAEVVSSGDIIVMAVSNLLQDAAWVAPTFALGENDNQTVFIAKWAKALFDGLRASGYIA
jgi:hypothetical protein